MRKDIATLYKKCGYVFLCKKLGNIGKDKKGF